MITIELKRLTDRIAMLERGIDRAVACCEAERKWRKRLQKRIADIEQDQRINDGDEK